MLTGMLWFDNSKTALTEKIQKAVDYYRKKYGRQPDLVLVHPSMMPVDQTLQAGSFQFYGLNVRPYRPVLPGHIWIGIEQKEPVDNGAEKES
jgi:hypothetical protein